MLDPRDWQDPGWKFPGQDHGAMKGPLQEVGGLEPEAWGLAQSLSSRE